MVEAAFHMPGYVYALHDFHPEHEDEVSFHAGERIEVLDKDDLYGDGWWQGRNTSGKTGLFPESYTSPLPPSASPVTISSSLPSNTSAVDQGPQPKTLLQPLPEESESESLNVSTLAVNAVASPTTHLNGHDSSSENALTNDNSDLKGAVNGNVSGDGEVMKATLTDVQRAIEQLGRAKSDHDGDGARSFSFASSGIGDRDTENETETDTDFDADRESDAAGGENWHRGARRKLAEKARRAVQEAEKLEMMMSGIEPTRNLVPPIQVELSDESEGEDEEHTHHPGPYDVERQHPHIPEEDEGQEDRREAPSTNTTLKKDTEVSDANDQEDLNLPALDESQLLTATATRTSFPSSVRQLPTPPAQNHIQEETNKSFLPYHARTPSAGREVQADPIGSTSSAPRNGTSVSQHSSVASSAALMSSSQSSSTQVPTPISISMTPLHEPEKKVQGKAPPSEWSVTDVVEWLKSKGFDQDVCDKFTEQEITGDVLLELDVNLLKTEIGIMAFGKRMRIANAITDLRRPPSIIYSDHPVTPHSPLHRLSNPLTLPFNTASSSNSRDQSQALPQAHMYSHGHSQSIQSSGQPSLHGPPTPGFFPVSPESAPRTGDMPGSPGFVTAPIMNGEREENRTISDGSMMNGSFADAVERAVIGLGIGYDRILNDKNRPHQLTVSPSDSALHKMAQMSSTAPEDGEEEAAVLSEGEVAHAPHGMRKRLFGRSQDSSATNKDKDKDKRSSDPSSSKSSGRISKRRPTSLSPDVSPTKELSRDDSVASVPIRGMRGRKTSDSGKSGERLSLFGTTFGAPLGKSRKPAPSTSEIADSQMEKGSSLSITRLYGHGGKKGKSLDQSPTDSKFQFQGRDSSSSKDRKEKDPALLRKRASPMPGSLKPGLSIVEQIGEVDYSGWMRKRGDRYNNWKQRYFVLKGPHLYCLKSDSKTETKIKGYINIVGYKVVADENANPGRYAFKIIHESDKTHFFSSDEKVVVREWMKAIMKATIGRDYTKPVISSCNIPTIPLTVAQAMNPAPRPPSPTARDATQKALRRENPNQLSSRDARVLMGLPSPSGELKENERLRLESFFTNETVSDYTPVVREVSPPVAPPAPIPPRPPRDKRGNGPTAPTPAELSLIEWANAHLPISLQITDPAGSLCGGLTLLRLAESIRGKCSIPPVPDSAFPSDPSDEKLEGLFRLFDFLLDNDVKMGAVSINDVRQGRRDKILQLLKALKAWEDKRKAFGQGGVGAGVTGVSSGWN